MPNLPTLAPLYTTGGHVDHELNSALVARLQTAGADFDTVEYRFHHAPNNLSQATDDQLDNAIGIAPGRRVLNLPGRTWAHTPDQCTDLSHRGEWVLDGLVMICPGCGIDCT